MNTFVRAVLGLRRIPFVRDVLTIQAGSLLFMLAGFVSSILFARLLGIERYGVYAVALAFAGTVNALLNIGQGQSLYVFFSEAYGRKDVRGMAAVLRNFVNIACINIVLLGIVALVMPLLAERLYGAKEIGYYGRIFSVFQITDLWNSMTLIILQSIRRIRLKVFLEQTANLSYLGLAVLSLFLGGGIRGILLTQLGVSIVFLPLSLFALRSVARTHRLPGIREVLRVPWRESEQFLLQGLIITLDKTIGNFFPQGLFFAFSLAVPAAFVGVARIAVQLASIPRNILLPQAGDLSVTAFGRMKAEGPGAVRCGAAKLIKHSVALHAVLTLGAMIAFPPLMYFFYGPQYWQSIPLAIWLLLIMLFSGLSLTNSPILRLYRKTHFSILGGVLAWIGMLSTFFVLIRFFPPAFTFLITFAVGQVIPLLITLYIFTRLLQETPKKSTA